MPKKKKKRSYDFEFEDTRDPTWQERDLYLDGGRRRDRRWPKDSRVNLGLPDYVFVNPKTGEFNPFMAELLRKLGYDVDYEDRQAREFDRWDKRHPPIPSRPYGTLDREVGLT